MTSVFNYAVVNSLRRLELLIGREEDYEDILCKMITLEVKSAIHPETFEPTDMTVSEVRAALNELSIKANRRIVLLFDDAAHLGREASLGKFFDIFRTISGSAISCKATVYPGVTSFGNRFDYANDSTIIEVTRNDELPGFKEFFGEVFSTRFGRNFGKKSFTTNSRLDIAGFLGTAVRGNIRAFVFACNELEKRAASSSISLDHLGETLKTLASNHFWPMLEEIRPKISKYSPLVGTSQRIAEILVASCLARGEFRSSVIVSKEVIENLAKAFEILEYANFITKRESSRAMKSGGRGARYALNLCLIMEQVPGGRLTRSLFDLWSNNEAADEPHQLTKATELGRIVPPQPSIDDSFAILKMPIQKLERSNIHPYGLTPAKIKIIEDAGYKTIEEVFIAPDQTLLNIPGIGEAVLKRIRSAIAQAIWM